MLLPIVLMILGLAFVVAEVFFVSLGLLSLIAGGLILAADLLAFQHSSAFGWTLVVVEVVLVPLLIRGAFVVLPKLSFGRRMLLGAPATPRGKGAPALVELVGRHGVAASELRPSGTARFGDDRVSVVSLGGLVPPGTEIVVVEVEGTEVRVRPLRPLPDDRDLAIVP